MRSASAKPDTGLSISFLASAVIHLAVFLLLAWSGRLLPSQMVTQETYYVDVVNLPVLAPQPGSPTLNNDSSEAISDASSTPVMKMPIPTKTIPKPVAAVAKNDVAESEKAFSERMAKLERISEAQREEAVLEKLRNKVKTGGAKNGTPAVTGAEAGSRYVDYIKSRLEDSLKLTSSYTSKNPEVAVRLIISPEGRLIKVKIERSSGDPTFELAVRRAIDLASEKFPVPPNSALFEHGFIFKPKGISGGT